MKTFLLALILSLGFIVRANAGAIMTADDAAWVGYGVAVEGGLNVLFFIPDQPFHNEDRYMADTDVYLGRYYNVPNHADPWLTFLFAQPFLLGPGLLDGFHVEHVMFGEVAGMFTNVIQTAKYEIDLRDHWHPAPRIVIIHQEF